MNRQLCLAAYDIAAPKRLAQAHGRLRAYATGGQKSVFECLLGAGERDHLLQEMGELIDAVEDSFLLLTLDHRARLVTMGRARAPRLGPFFYEG